MTEADASWAALRASPFRIHAVTLHNSSVVAESALLYGERVEVFHQAMSRNYPRLVRQLAEDGIDYDSIAKALVPSQKRREIALLFDWAIASEMSSGFYAVHLASTWLPGLPLLRKGNGMNSVLHGDILDGHTGALESALVSDAFLVDENSVNARTLYAVYITNLSSVQARDLVTAVRRHPAYVGYADCTMHGPLKDLLARSLPHLGLRIGSKILDGVGGEVPNPGGLPLKEHGYSLVGVPDDLFLPFLTFRINSRLSGVNAADLTAGVGQPGADAAAIESPVLWLDQGRFDYLHRSHGGSLGRAGLADLGLEGLRAALTELLSQAHLYNFRRESYENTGHVVFMYNARVEINTAQGWQSFILGLKFERTSRTSELITFI